MSNLGRVKTLPREVSYINKNGKLVSFQVKEKIRKPVKLKNGYMSVILRKNNKSYCKYVHRLVANAFIENPNSLPCINHKDFNRENNNVENLEWCTAEYNVQYSVGVPVRQYTLDGNLVCEYPSMTYAENKLGLSNDSIRKAILKNRPCCGFKWGLINDVKQESIR